MAASLDRAWLGLHLAQFAYGRDALPLLAVQALDRLAARSA
jgi:hypothetical protein